ncbi:MAG: deoxynucleoside kinase [Ruminococcus sp.]|nr:deoxynucleoside kinase [Ruminococcus sp.]
MQNRLLVVEGLDGSGKSTQVSLLKAKLESDGTPVRQIKLPDYDDPSSTLVKMYLGGEFGKNPEDVNVYAASSFYAVDRYASFRRHWQKDYENGTLILADRYTTSNAVHQAVKLPESAWENYLSWLADYEYNKLGIPAPDAVIFLDMPVAVSQKLMTARYNGEEAKKDVHEANVSYLNACRKAALFAASKLGWYVVPCADGDEPLPIAQIHARIYEIVKKKM